MCSAVRSGVILAVETSGPWCIVAGQNQEGVRAEQISSARQSHSEDIVELIDSVLKSLSCTSADIGCFLLGSGPGSFTGLRIGFATVKGLATVHQASIIPVPSLLAFAAPHLVSGRPVVSLADARRGELFVAVYQHMSGALHTLLEACILTPAELTAWIQKRLSVGPVVTGSLEDGSDLASEFVFTASERTGSAMIGLLEQGFSGEVHSSESGFISLDPLYIRSVAARTLRERAKDQ